MTNTSAFMKILFLLLSCCFLCKESIAQFNFKTTPVNRGKTINISSIQKFRSAEVQLYELTTDAIYAIPIGSLEGHKIYKFPIEKIGTITYKKKKWNESGTLIGAFVGMASGYALGRAMGGYSDSCFLFCLTGKQKGALLGTLLGIAGGGIGSQIGIRVRIPINGSKKKYQAEQQRLKQFLLLE